MPGTTLVFCASVDVKIRGGGESTVAPLAVR